MKNRVILKIALKNLLGRRSRSVITIGGLAIAIALVVIFVSLGYGLQQMVIEDFTTLEALKTIDVTAEKSEQIRLDNEVLEEFKTIKGVEDTLPVVEIGAKMTYKDSATDVAVIGLSKDTFAMWTSLSVDERESLEAFEDRAVIVSEAASNLVGATEGIKGQKIKLNLSIGVYADGKENIEEEFEVLAKETSTESPMVLIPIEYLQTQGVNRYSMAKVVVKTPEDVSEARIVIEKKGYKTHTVQDTVEQISEIFTLIRLALATFGFVAAIVATLGMFNTLTVSLLEKTREIGILKALGAQRMTVLKLFLAEAVIMASSGGILGLIIGVMASWAIQIALGVLASTQGHQLERLFIFPPLFMLGVFVSTMIVGLLTGFYPAHKASSINTLDALRYE